MNSLVYEKSADKKNYIYLMDFPDMKKVEYRFFGQHVHRSVELLICYKGKMRFNVNDTNGVLNEGEILIINSFDTHYYEYVDNAACFILVISLDHLDDVLTKENIEFNNKIVPNNESFDFILSLLKNNFSLIEDKNELFKKAFVLNLFGELSKYNLFQEKNMTVDKALASRILNYISEHYMEPLDLETVAREFGYSRNYFSMLFNKIVGMGFNAYLNIYRMDKVNEMKSVNKDKLKINDILAKCGFASSETYYRTVRKMKRDYYGKID